MLNPAPLSLDSPFRLAVDQLLEQLLTGMLAGLNPMERALLRRALTQRGWDLARLSQRGPLSGVSDAELLVLMEALSDRLDELVLTGPLPVGFVPVADALASLHRSLALA